MINTQGALGLEYAAQGALLDLTPLFAREAAIKSRYDQNYLGNWVYEGKNYMVPFYITKTLLFYNKPMFAKAGLAGPPKNFDEILAFAQKMTSGEIASGFMTLNFDWLYWPLFAMNGVELVTPDLKKTTFNTPKAIEVVDKLAKATQSGAINKISWTGRWVEPNGAFGAGNVGMLHAHSPAYFFFKGQGSWVTPETLGVAQMPGNFATPNSHGLGVSKGSKNPELAWEFVKFITDNAQAGELAERRKLVTGNVAVDTATLAKLAKDDPVVYQVLKTQVEHTDKMVGNWRFGNDTPDQGSVLARAAERAARPQGREDRARRRRPADVARADAQLSARVGGRSPAGVRRRCGRPHRSPRAARRAAAPARRSDPPGRASRAARPRPGDRP